MILFPNCKINLGLHIGQKRPDSFHDLQTVFYPIPLNDALEMVHGSEGQTVGVELTVSGLEVDGLPEDNICVKAYQLLKADHPQLPPVRIHLHKQIPMGAGLGGGSANGAFALRLLDQKFALRLSQEQLISYAARLGSDCPFFIINMPCFGAGRGELLTPIELDLGAYDLVLVNPAIHVPTGWAFGQLDKERKQEQVTDIIRLPVAEWRNRLTNDFEGPVFREYPQIGAIKERLYEAGADYAAMSGSGSTVFGLFKKEATPDLYFPEAYFVRRLALSDREY